LKDVFSISGAAGNALGSAENAAMMVLEERFQLSRRFVFH
jgi:hypothetical protein